MRFPLVVVLLSLMSTQVPAAQNESRSERFVVSVRDQAGKYVWGLRAQDFIIEENGASQTITAFAASDAPVSVGILVDTSLSMYLQLPGVADTAEGLVRAAKPQDEMMLMTFSSVFSVAQVFTNDPQKIIKKLRGLGANGHCSSPVVDSIIQAAGKLKNAKHRRRALVVFTDGEDNTSGSFDQLRRELLGQEIVLYFAKTSYRTTKGELPPRGPEISVSAVGGIVDLTIGGCSISLSQAPAIHGGSLLNALAEESGGRHVDLAFKSDKAWVKIAESFLDGLLTDVRGQYALSYRTTAPDTGLRPAIRIRTTTPDHQIQLRREASIPRAGPKV